jgi:Transcriptional regulator
MSIDRAAVAQQRLDTRRVKMCRTAAQLFRDRGYDATSVSDVARALGMTKAGLYHHFESKEALLFEIMMYGLDRVRDDVIIPARTIRNPEERLRAMIVSHARIATRGQGAVAHLGDEIRALPPGGPPTDRTADARLFRSDPRYAPRVEGVRAPAYRRPRRSRRSACSA